MASLSTLTAAGLVRLVGMGRQVVVARVFGVSEELDIYLAALVLPLFLANILGVAFNAVGVPNLTRVRHQFGVEAEAGALRHTLKLALVTSGLASLTLVIAAPLVLQLVAPYLGGNPAAVQVARLGGLLPIAAVLTEVLIAACLVQRSFFLAAISPVVIPVLLSITALVAGPSPLWLMVATVFSQFVLCVWLGTSLWRHGLLRPKQAIAIAPSYPWSETFAMTASVAASGLAVGVHRSLASRIEPGALSALEIGTRVSESFEGLIGVLIVNVGAVALASLAVRDSQSRFRGVSIKAALTIALVAAIPTLVLIWFSPQIVGFLFGGEQFNAESTATVIEVQRTSLARVPFYLSALLLSRALNSTNRSWSVARIMGVFAVVSVVGSLVLIPDKGVAGITIATACSYVIVAVLSFAAMSFVPRRRTPTPVGRS